MALTHQERTEAVYRLDLPHYPKALLLYLVHRVNLRTRTTDPSLATISADTGLSRDTILRARNDLRSRGLISWVKRLRDSTYNDTTVYKVLMPQLWRARTRGGSRSQRQGGSRSQRHSTTTASAEPRTCIECGKKPAAPENPRCPSCSAYVESDEAVRKVVPFPASQPH